MLKPLYQFVCDECGEIIEKPDDGYVEWINDGKKVEGFRIVHNTVASPYGTRIGCFKYTDYIWRSDIDLSNYLETAHQRLYSLLDIGYIIDPNGTFKTKISNFREFVEFARRITIPYYEEARMYFNEAISDGYIEPSNEISLYLERTLKGIINEYSDK